MPGRSARFSSRAHAGTMRHLRLTFPAIHSPNPQAGFDQIIQILDQVCRQYKKQVPAFAWKPISVTSRELKIIRGTESVHNSLMTQKGDISVIHADKRQTFGKRYTLQISHDRSNISLAVSGSRELYDLLIDLNHDGNLLLSHKALLRPAGSKKILTELQLVTMPSGDDHTDNYMYSLSYKRPFKRTAADRTLLKAMQLQQLSLTPDLYADMNNDGHAQKITGREFEKMFGVKLLQGLSVVSDGTDDIILDLKTIHGAYHRLQPYIDGHLSYDEGIKNGSLQDVSQESLLDTILAQAKKKQFLPRVAINWVSDRVRYGLMAGEGISAGTIIGEYCGEISRVSALDNQQDNTYFAAYAPDEVPGSESFVVDAKKGGNSTRFINHSDENANVGWARVFDGKRFRLVIAAVRPISKGKQILLKYRDSYWSSKTKTQIHRLK